MSQLVLAALFFLGLHLLPSTSVRASAIARMGETAYMGVFSLASIGGLVWLVGAYNAAPSGDMLWTTGPLWRWINVGLMLLLFVLLIGGATSPNPASVMAGQSLKREEPWRGVFAVTRHPVMWATGLWAPLHMINRPEPASLVFFGALALLAIGGTWLQDRRKARDLGAEWQRYAEHTSFVPFAALAAGRAQLRIRDLGWWQPALAVVLWAVVLHFHGRLFGVPAIPI